MNEQRKTGKLQTLLSIIEKRRASMNKGSKLLLRIASGMLLAGILSAAFLLASTMSGLSLFEDQLQMVEWLILYSLRVWVMLVCGSLILDYLKGGQE